MVNSYKDLFALGLSSNTLNSYKSAWNLFGKYCETNKCSLLPADVTTILNYVHYLLLQKKKVTSIRLHLSSIGHFHKIEGFDDPTTGYRVKLAVRGASQYRPPVIDKRVPVSKEIYQMLRTQLLSTCSSVYESLLFGATIALLYEGWFRIGELLAPSKVKVNESRLLVDGIAFEKYGSVVIRLSKDKTSKGKPRKIEFHPANDTRSFLFRYKRRRPSFTSGPFLIHIDGTPLTVGQFRSVFKTLVIKAGLDPTIITPHSFRIGGCSRSKAEGLTDEVIQARGRWVTRGMLSRYTRSFPNLA